MNRLNLTLRKYIGPAKDKTCAVYNYKYVLIKNSW